MPFSLAAMKCIQYHTIHSIHCMQLRVNHWILVCHVQTLAKKTEVFSTPWKLLEAQLGLFAKLAKVINQAGFAPNDISGCNLSLWFNPCSGKQH